MLKSNLFVAMVLVPTASNTLIVLVGYWLEKLMPARRQNFSATFLNLKHLIPYHCLHMLTLPFAALLSVATVSAAGGGWIMLPESGWWLVASIAAFTFAMDFVEFAFHVAQHKLPFLWALHSLHHSDKELNVSTTQRHFWADQAIKTLTIYSVVGLVFKANSAVLAGYGIISVYNFYLHMNTRGALGRFSWVINTPQYHRLHHSCRPEDQDIRYAALFPIFDVIFGTYRKPNKGDYPETGLDSGATPADIFQAVIWPLQRFIHTPAVSQVKTYS